jgi:hypothetical protein
MEWIFFTRNEEIDATPERILFLSSIYTYGHTQQLTDTYSTPEVTSHGSSPTLKDGRRMAQISSSMLWTSPTATTPSPSWQPAVPEPNN